LKKKKKNNNNNNKAKTKPLGLELYELAGKNRAGLNDRLMVDIQLILKLIYCLFQLGFICFAAVNMRNEITRSVMHQNVVQPILNFNSNPVKVTIYFLMLNTSR
jgi:hypothetical protein